MSIRVKLKIERNKTKGIWIYDREKRQSDRYFAMNHHQKAIQYQENNFQDQTWPNKTIQGHTRE